LVHQAAFGTLGPFSVILGTIGTFVTFGTPVAFLYTEERISV